MTDADHTLADDILADAFSGNEITGFLFGDSAPHDRLVRLNRRVVRHGEGSGTIAELDGEPAGVLLQGRSPRCEPADFAGLRFLMDAILATRLRFFKVAALSRESARHHPEWAHRHLTVLGIRRSLQGRGVGSTLLENFCRAADEAGDNSYLETDSEGGRRLYARFGFTEVGRTVRGGVTLIYMWRAAKPV